MDLVYKNETVLKVVSLIVSALAWAALLYFTKGLVLIYVLLFGLIYLFAQSALIAHIKGTGVRVAADQYVDLHERFEKCCQQIGLEPAPQYFVLRTNSFNALATRFLGRNLVVLFADVLDALKDNPAALNFYMGHELGHLRRKHLCGSRCSCPPRSCRCWGRLITAPANTPATATGWPARRMPCPRSTGCWRSPRQHPRHDHKPGGVRRQVEESTGFWMSSTS